MAIWINMGFDYDDDFQGYDKLDVFQGYGSCLDDVETNEVSIVDIRDMYIDYLAGALDGIDMENNPDWDTDFSDEDAINHYNQVHK